MLKAVIGVLALLCPLLCWAQRAPSVVQWIALFQEVRTHELFKDLQFTYAKAPSENVGYSPVGVIPRDGLDCVVVIAEGHNPNMDLIARQVSRPEDEHAFLLAIAAHELGHCIRIRSKNLSPKMWELVAATSDGSPERESIEKKVSLEEGYADAYALVYIHDALPLRYDEVFAAMQRLRRDPAFVNPHYQVRPLYEGLQRHGLELGLSLPDQVEAVMLQSALALD